MAGEERAKLGKAKLLVWLWASKSSGLTMELERKHPERSQRIASISSTLSYLAHLESGQSSVLLQQVRAFSGNGSTARSVDVC